MNLVQKIQIKDLLSIYIYLNHHKENQGREISRLRDFTPSS